MDSNSSKPSPLVRLHGFLEMTNAMYKDKTYPSKKKDAIFKVLAMFGHFPDNNDTAIIDDLKQGYKTQYNTPHMQKIYLSFVHFSKWFMFDIVYDKNQLTKYNKLLYEPMRFILDIYTFILILKKHYGFQPFPKLLAFFDECNIYIESNKN